MTKEDYILYLKSKIEIYDRLSEDYKTKEDDFYKLLYGYSLGYKIACEDALKIFEEIMKNEQ